MERNIRFTSEEPIPSPLTAGIGHLNGKDPVIPIMPRYGLPLYGRVLSSASRDEGRSRGLAVQHDDVDRGERTRRARVSL